MPLDLFGNMMDQVRTCPCRLRSVLLPTPFRDTMQLSSGSTRRAVQPKTNVLHTVEKTDSEEGNPLQ